MKGFIKDKKFRPIGNYTKKGVTKNSRMKRFENSKIQSLRFPKNKFSMSESKEWASDHGYTAVKVEPSPNYWRIRQFSPNKIKRGGECRTIQLGGSGVQGILCETPDRFKRTAIELNVKEPLEETNTARRKGAMLMKLSNEKSVLSEPEINWMKKFINGSFGLAQPNDKEFIDKMINKINESDGFMISPELNQKGIDFLRKNKNKLSAREKNIIDDFDFFTFEGFNSPDNFGRNQQPIWRVNSKPHGNVSDAFEYQWYGGEFILR